MGDDALSAALQMFTGGGMNSRRGPFFPGARLASDRSELNDMLGQSPETSFLQSGKPTPSPSPTPQPVKPSKMTLAQLYDHFEVQRPIRAQQSPSRNGQKSNDWMDKYGWGSAYS